MDPIEETRGGPAFPTSSDHVDEGMTLRDYFAGQALAGWLASYIRVEEHPAARANFLEQLAGNSYKVADAMLEARTR